MSELSNMKHARRGEAGFSLLQMIATIAIVAIVSAFAVISITQARASMRLQASVKTFAGNVERARLDAIRRRSSATVDISGPDTYDITMDFNSNGTPFTRRFTLESGVVFTDANNATLTIDGSGDVTSPNGDPVPWADFNFRGRTTECTMLFRFRNSNSESSTVQVMGSGDVTINTAVFTPANVSYTNVNATSDVVTTATINGANIPVNLSPCDSSGGGGGGSGTIPVGTCSSGGTIAPSVGTVTVRRNGGSTATVNITVNQAGTITANPASNLSVTPATRAMTSTSGGTVSFTISSNNRSRGLFTVSFSNPCSSTSIQVKVTN